jgi:hypothetical protein
MLTKIGNTLQFPSADNEAPAKSALPYPCAVPGFVVPAMETFSLARLVGPSRGLSGSFCLNRGTTFSAALSMLLLRYERQGNFRSRLQGVRRTEKDDESFALVFTIEDRRGSGAKQ